MQGHYQWLAKAYLRGTSDAGVDSHLHRFKRSAGLPRVRAVLGILHGLAPASLLDIGSGRGAFLWPLLDSFPELPVTAIDRAAGRVALIDAVRRGGVAPLGAVAMDATRLGFADRSFDLVSLLEVLEHLPEPRLAAAEAIRVANRFVVASVPSKPDDNPQHIQLFSAESLTALFLAADARRVKIDHVLNHMIGLVTV